MMDAVEVINARIGLIDNFITSLQHFPAPDSILYVRYGFIEGYFLPQVSANKAICVMKEIIFHLDLAI